MQLLLPNHVKLKEKIDEVLDMELIKQQMNSETFEYQKYLNTKHVGYCRKPRGWKGRSEKREIFSVHR